MPTLDVISVNLWQILISLVNLFLLFLIIKKFLFKPVKQVLEKRQQMLDDRYAAAEEANLAASENKRAWEEKLSAADAKADAMIQTATEQARYRGERIVEEAEARADSIVRTAQSEAELARRKATEEIKREIVEVSEALTEKLLEREIKVEDHRALVDSFLTQIGDSNA